MRSDRKLARTGSTNRICGCKLALAASSRERNIRRDSPNQTDDVNFDKKNVHAIPAASKLQLRSREPRGPSNGCAVSTPPAGTAFTDSQRAFARHSRVLTGKICLACVEKHHSFEEHSHAHRHTSKAALAAKRIHIRRLWLKIWICTVSASGKGRCWRPPAAASRCACCSGRVLAHRAAQDGAVQGHRGRRG